MVCEICYRRTEQATKYIRLLCAMALGESTTDKYQFFMYAKRDRKNMMYAQTLLLLSLASKAPFNRFMLSSKAIFMHACV